MDSILEFWFSDYITIPKFWFDKNKETDEYIKTNFYELLKQAENHQLNDWKSSVKGHLALIILLDQFSRHIYRDTTEQYKNDTLAYHYTKEFMIEKKDIELKPLELMMVLMPFRHQDTEESYTFLFDYLEDKTDIIWTNFKKHTSHNYELFKKNGSYRDDSNKYVIDWNKFTNILEYQWNFSIQTYSLDSELNTTLTNYINNNMIKDKNNIIIVSLSGGVDSMVILYLLSEIRKKIINLQVIAIHIDYRNRPETGLEAEFIMNYCNFMNIPLYYRYIHESMRERSSKKREEYEEMTKDLRFNLYKTIINKYIKDSICMGVILGHHKGDLQENIFQNVMKGRNLTDLSVIKEQSDILGVKILRLLLKHPKKDIFDMAHKNNIPYFKNTTPSWSNRGNLREIIIPNIIKTFGEGVLTNLSKVGKESDELQLLVKENIINPYMKTIEIKDSVHFLPITPNQPFTYWKYIFNEWCHINNLSTISYKLMVQIYDKIYLNQKINITCGEKLQLLINNNYIVVTIKN